MRVITKGLVHSGFHSLVFNIGSLTEVKMLTIAFHALSYSAGPSLMSDTVLGSFKLCNCLNL